MPITTHTTKQRIGRDYLTPEVIGTNSLTPNDALNEFVANSLDWKITDQSPDILTKIHIIFSTDKIEILDNGQGMTVEELDVAKDLARAREKVRERTSTAGQRSGTYGVGMKVASLTLAWKVTIITRSFKEENKEHRYVYDSKAASEQGDKYSYIIETRSDSDIPSNSPLSDFSSGTYILLENLTEKGRELSNKDLIPVKDHVTASFWPDFEGLINAEKLECKLQNKIETQVVKRINRPDFAHDILKLDFENPDSRWAKKSEYIYTDANGNNHQLKGFLQSLKKRALINHGINVYVKGQLVKRFVKDPLLKGVPPRNREMIYGEINLTGGVAANVKNAIYHDDAFNQVIKLIHDDLMVYSPWGAATSKARKERDKEIARRLNDDQLPPPPIEPIDPVGPDEPKRPDTPREEPRPTDVPEEAIMITEKLYFIINSEDVSVDHKLPLAWKGIPTDEGIQQPTSCRLFKLILRINTKSPLCEELKKQGLDTKKSMHFFRVVAACESLLNILIETEHMRHAKARRLIDEKVYPILLKKKWN